MDTISANSIQTTKLLTHIIVKMRVLTSGLCRILNCFTIHFLLSHVVKLFRFRSKSFYLGYGVFVLGFLYSLVQIILVSVCLTNFRFAFMCRYINASFRFFITDFLDNDPLIILGGALFVIHAGNLLHYVLFDLMKFFKRECDEILAFMKCHHDNRMTLLDCLFRWISIQEIKRALNNMINLVPLSSNLFLTHSDRRKIIIYYKIFEAGFTFCLFIVFLTSFIFQLLIWLALVGQKLQIFYCLEIIFLGMFFQFLFLAGIVCPILLAMVVNLTTVICFRPWARYSRKLIRTCPRLAQRPEVTTLLILKLMAGKLFFLHGLTFVVKLNRKLCRTVFSRSLIITLTANVLFIAKICLHSPSPILKIFILATLSFQFIIIVGLLFFAVFCSELMYRSSETYMNSHATLTHPRRSIDLTKLIKLSNFIEIFHRKKRYSFSLASIGKITRKSLFNFLPVYSSFLMFIFPFYRQNF